MEAETGLGRRDWESSWILHKDVKELRLSSGNGERGRVSREQEEKPPPWAPFLLREVLAWTDAGIGGGFLLSFSEVLWLKCL